MKLFLLALLPFAVLHYSGGQFTSCNDPYVDINGICYYFNPPTTTVSWIAARESCLQMGAELAIVDTPEKNEAIGLYIAENIDITSQYKWIALNDQAEENTFIWDGTGTETSYTNWYIKSSIIGYNCVTLTLEGNYEWENLNCSSQYSYICQEKRKSCEAPFIALGESCYYFSGNTLVTWSVAHNNCNKMNSSLITIETEYEDTLITNTLKQGYPFQWHWIGAYDRGHVGDWYWESNGRPLDYTNWQFGYPITHSTSMNCANTASDFNWQNADCDRKFWFICEKHFS